MILTGLKLREWIDDGLNWEIECERIGSFNLFIGDNAQGKTRLFNVLRFARDVQKIPFKFVPGLRAEWLFRFSDGNDRIEFTLGVSRGSNGASLHFDETIDRSGRTLFSRSGKTLLDESSGEPIREFYIPDNASAVFALSDEKFATIGKIRSFFERMVFLEANRFSSKNFQIDDKADVLNSDGSNVGSVMADWKDRSPRAFGEIISEFQGCFDFVEAGSLETKPALLAGMQKPATLLFMREKRVQKEIPQTEWSDGMLRTLGLLSLPLTRFQGREAESLRPSLVFVDEIENGLDFKTLRKIFSFYQEHSGLTQILIVSHSPLVCNMVDPRDWRVAKRSGSRVTLDPPDPADLDLNSRRENLLLDNWEFYRRHISTKTRGG